MYIHTYICLPRCMYCVYLCMHVFIQLLKNFVKVCMYVYVHLSNFPLMTDYTFIHMHVFMHLWMCLIRVRVYVSMSLSFLSNCCQGNLASRLYSNPTTSKSLLRAPNLLSSCTNTIGVDKRVSLIFSNAFSTSGVLHQRGPCVIIPPRKYQWTSVRSMAQVNVVQTLGVYISKYACMYVLHH